MAGQFYFAWVDETDTTFSVLFRREDEKVFSFSLHQAEGDFASLDVVIINPRIGFLAPGRKQWAWFAYEHPTEGTKPLFFGRLVAVPEDLHDEQVSLTFVARPPDFAEQKAAVAATKRVAPFWDPIWFAPETRDDPDNVLESRCELWHIDPRTLVVSTSNIVLGEGGTIALDEGDVFVDGMRLRYGQAPARRVNVAADVSWDQKAKGEVDISHAILAGFLRASSGSGWGTIYSYTGEGLINSWPKQGASFGGGWTVSYANIRATKYMRPATQFEDTYWVNSAPVPTGEPFEYFVFDSGFRPHGGLLFPVWHMQQTTKLSYDVSRRKTEKLAFTLEADIQAVVTEPGDEETINLKLSSGELTSPVDYGDALPIGDQKARSYFTTPRGAQSIEYLLMLARAALLARARCVYIDIELPFDDAVRLNVDCRKNISLSDVHLPGGIATGKVMEYTFSLDGDTGTMLAAVTFGSTVGQGGTVSAAAGTPDYAETGYMETGYQTYTGQVVLPIVDEIGYTSIEGTLPNDDGIDFNHMDPRLGGKLVKDVFVQNGANAQGGAMPFHGPVTNEQKIGTWHQFYIIDPSAHAGAAGANTFRPEYDPAKAVAALNEMPTQVQMTLHNLNGGPFNTDYPLEVTELKVPKLIDLEAPSLP